MTKDRKHPVLAISAGDPRGIGPEVIVRALSDSRVRNRAGWRIYGSSAILEQAAEAAGVDVPWWVTGAEQVEDMRPVRGQIQIVDAGTQKHRTWHDFDERAAGRASLEYLTQTIDACLLRRELRASADGLVTAPISKAAWAAAGLRRFPGHTELLADRTRSKQFAMMFVAPGLRVILATTHIPLMGLRNTLTIGRVYEPIALAHDALRSDFGLVQPRIAVCGLNPHAGEGGLFGDEESRLIEPAIRQAVEQGIMASGPYPADTVFNAALDGRFDCVVAMYHDQGLIPVKLLARDSAVNVTVGLPIVRTSPDHGTAFDIVGQNKAHPGSMKAAMVLAADLACRRFDLAEAGSTPTGAAGDALDGSESAAALQEDDGLDVAARSTLAEDGRD